MAILRMWLRSLVGWVKAGGRAQHAYSVIAADILTAGSNPVGANSFAHGRINPPLHFQPRLFRFKSVIRLLCGAMLLLTLTPAHAAPSEYELKAAFIYQIARFVEWPSAPVNAGEPLRLCVLGGNPFGPALESIRGKPVNERRMEVSLLDMNADTHECNMLFIAAPAERHIERITALSRGTGMLTIGDTQGFAQRGAMVNFFSQDGKIRFEVNLDAARHGGLKISSKLLSLARIVDSGLTH